MDRILPCTPEACGFNKVPTLPTIVFEALVLGLTIGILSVLLKKDKRALTKYGLLMIGVFIFEMFTAPMWNNERLGQFAYLYIDVSWILTIGWTTLIIYVMFMVDHFKKKAKEAERFGWYLLVLTPLVLIFESLVVKLGIRSYSPEVQEVVSNNYLPFLDIPVAGLYYIPIFLALVIGFYKYWVFYAEHKLLVPVKKSFIVRKFSLIFVGVFLFEMMIEPMVQNVGMPSLFTVYRDVNLMLSLIWILIILLSIKVIDSFFPHFDLVKKFIGYMLVGATIATPIEAWLISNGVRVYGESAVANFSGLHTIFFNVPIEVVFAVPFYLALIIAFTKYWEFVMDNSL